ncbi:DUF2721 domain-containing protein [Pontibacter indicus]|uniref:Uncharacterized protein n=1 Tax=Pontibacter indicus TaxID=1317125 RepID=A0A1R3XM21_9BACT|nr:DUF2721 domain-containing protein [Pontibacter indicus]SIT92699.1 hypothetical protein SAMN05444128_2924 [Pontibacter indicus]
MLILFAGYSTVGKYTFGLSLSLLIISLAPALREIRISVKSLELELDDFEETSAP